MGNIESQMAPLTVQRSNHRRGAQIIKRAIMKEYDKSKTGTLSRQEVTEMATAILGRVAPNMGGLTFEEVELIMCLGGSTTKPEITAEDLPQALAIIASVKEENHNLERLFSKFDVDKTGELPANQLTALLTEVNAGVPPTVGDVTYVLTQCEPRGAADPIKKTELKAALACWYCLAEETDEQRTSRLRMSAGEEIREVREPAKSTGDQVFAEHRVVQKTVEVVPTTATKPKTTAEKTAEIAQRWANEEKARAHMRAQASSLSTAAVEENASATTKVVEQGEKEQVVGSSLVISAEPADLKTEHVSRAAQIEQESPAEAEQANKSNVGERKPANPFHRRVFTPMNWLPCCQGERDSGSGDAADDCDTVSHLYDESVPLSATKVSMPLV